MKRTGILFLFLAAFLLGSGQNRENATPLVNQDLLPSKYQVMLYADEVTDHSGNNHMIASHWQNQGGGSFLWQQDLPAEDDYEVAISYAGTETGVLAVVSAGGDSLSGELAPTSGYYPVKEGWATFNCEKRLMPGHLHLKKGRQTISLKLFSKEKTQETILYSLTFLPVSRKKENEEDRLRAEKSRPNMDWFASAGYGVMFHWTSQSMPEHGPQKPYQQAVQDFSVDRFVDQVVKTGAAYVVLTTNHAEPYFPAPLPAWEAAYPNHTASRDLIIEIAEGLQKHHIRLFLYLATHVYAKYDSVDDKTFTRLNNDLIGAIGRRYKDKLAGFWFDGWYQCYEKHPGFDFESFYKICKTGNPDRMVALNSWLYPTVSCWQDYWAGEVYTLGKPAGSRVLRDGPGAGLQSNNLIVMETENWLHTDRDTKIPAPHLQAEELGKFILQSMGKGPVTINMQIYQDGRVGDGALSVMQAVKKIVRH